MKGDRIAWQNVFGVGIDTGGTTSAVALDDTENASCRSYRSARRWFPDLGVRCCSRAFGAKKATLPVWGSTIVPVGLDWVFIVIVIVVGAVVRA